MSNLPVLGAAMMVNQIEAHREWLREAPRDLEIQDFLKPDVLDGEWRGLAERGRSMIDGFEGRIGIHGPFIGLNIASGDPDIQAVVARRMDQALDICEVLGANQIVIHSPFTTWMFNNRYIWADLVQRVTEAAHATLGAAVRRAEDQGCVFVIENIEDKDPAERRALAESFGSPAIAVSLDTGHAGYAHGATGAPPVDAYVRSAGETLQHVHLQDMDGYADRHWPLGRGCLHWHPIFEALRDAAPDARLILELKDARGILESAAHLKALGLAQ